VPIRHRQSRLLLLVPFAANSSEACGADNYGSVYNASIGSLNKRSCESDALPFMSAQLNRPRQRGWLNGRLWGDGILFIL